MATLVERKTAKRGSAPSTILAGRGVDDRSLRTRPKRTGLLVAAALMVIVFGLGFALLLSQAGEKTSVLTIREPVSKGQVVERENLVSKQVAGASGAIETADVGTVIGKTAAVDLVAGQILNREMITGDPIPGQGKATVGLSLDPSRVPSAGLKPGSVVNVVAVPDGESGGPDDSLNTPPLLAEAAEVYSVDGAAKEGGGLLVTLIVDADESARLAAYSTRNRVAVVETSAADEAQ